MSKNKVAVKDVSVTISIPLHIYPVNVIFSFNTTNEQVKKILLKEGVPKKDIRKNIHKMGELTGGKWAFYREELLGVIRMHTIPATSRDYSILAHEIFHMAATIMEQIGMSLEVGVSDEAYAYLTSYLTEQVYTKLNKY